MAGGVVGKGKERYLVFVEEHLSSERVHGCLVLFSVEEDLSPVPIIGEAQQRRRLATAVTP